MGRTNVNVEAVPSTTVFDQLGVVPAPVGVIVLSVVATQGLTIAMVQPTLLPPGANDEDVPPVYLLFAVTTAVLATVTATLPTASSLLA